MKIFVIGAFECEKKTPFPSHVPPILAEHSTEGFRRIFYNASITPLDVPGKREWEQQPENLLKYISAIRIAPQAFRLGDQVIYLGNKKLLVGRNKFFLSLRLIPHVFSHRFFRAVLTIVNIYS